MNGSTKKKLAKNRLISKYIQPILIVFACFFENVIWSLGNSRNIWYVYIYIYRYIHNSISREWCTSMTASADNAWWRRDGDTNDHTIMTWWRHDVSSSCATLGKPGFYVKSHLVTCDKPGFDIKPSLVTLVSLWWYRHVIVMLSCRHTPSRFWYTYRNIVYIVWIMII